ncbi:MULTISPECIES: hypothetical protein [Moorena]|uniref:hypothetical protein n=1 Tax=Moorena TaxID=1155738 RepID=UPI0002E7B4BC|nr:MULTISPECIES: hypothetical protein [Moorena]NEQ14708.1 hypothetical protein [Moorena sp. SIO3E2]NEP31378.1 hypothetical protein [Moorena sp. SIO3B2]NEP66514.1 hypothetical protein [Moorena sp. SIO3A5]NEQ06925.1 hypothetical protein [Moorena sp. SIO4E2]NER86272.1 hypothetical protein [Moorena sp. SIO3A2]
MSNSNQVNNTVNGIYVQVLNLGLSATRSRSTFLTLDLKPSNLSNRQPQSH